MTQAVKLLPVLSSVASKSEKTSISELERIAIDSKAIYADIKQLLDSNQRRPLKGKLEQFRQKYDNLYFNLHRRMVGEDAPWAQLAEIRVADTAWHGAGVRRWLLPKRVRGIQETKWCSRGTLIDPQGRAHPGWAIHEVATFP